MLGLVGGTCVAKVIAADAEGDPPWLATEYVPGPTLARRAEEAGALCGDELYGVAAGLAEALVSLHEAGVVHRDLKPANVILSPSGPRVVDFGIAQLLDQTAITRTGHLVGSPGWVSSEEYRGEVAGFAADVHGWALLVAYAATGQPPYGTGRPEVLALWVMNDAVDLSGVPDDLRELVERALSKDPEARPEAREVLDTVTRLWCERHGEPYAASTADVTRLLARTWSMPLPDEPPAGMPPVHTPTPVRKRHRRRAVWRGVLAALAPTVMAASVVVFFPQINLLREKTPMKSRAWPPTGSHGCLGSATPTGCSPW